MSQTDHDLTELKNRDDVWRCKECGIVQPSKESFEMYNCNPTRFQLDETETTDQDETPSQEPPESVSHTPQRDTA